jgi:hypothetical protein
VTITYTAYAPPADPEPRALDIAGRGWSWLLVGGFGKPPSPYTPDTRHWAPVSLATEVAFRQGLSGPWVPTTDCVPATADAFHLGWIGLPLSGYTCGVGYYGVSPSAALYCGGQAAGDGALAGEGYWLDVEEPDIWLRVDLTP